MFEKKSVNKDTSFIHDTYTYTWKMFTPQYFHNHWTIFNCVKVGCNRYIQINKQTNRHMYLILNVCICWWICCYYCCCQSDCQSIFFLTTSFLLFLFIAYFLIVFVFIAYCVFSYRFFCASMSIRFKNWFYTTCNNK